MNALDNSNKTLENLLRTVQSQAARAVDFLAPTNQLHMVTGDDGNNGKISQIVIEGDRGEPTKTLAANNVAFNQIAGKAGIDVRTAARLQQNYSTEFDSVINAIWKKEPATRMVRAHMGKADNHGIARAFVSDRFKTFDNVHLLQSALPQLMDSPAQWRVVDGTVTDQQLYLRLKSLIHTGDGAAVGDAMALGIGLSNSEVGMGSVNVYQMIYTLACLNGMQSGNKSRSSHITGSRGDADTWGLLTDEAKDADNKALELKVRDLVSSYSSRESFDLVLEKMRAAAVDVVDSGLAAVENLGKVLTLTKKDTASIMEGLLQTMSQAGYAGRPVSRATLVNAVTAAAHNAEPDNVDDWQKLGGRVLDLPRADWARVAAAA